MLLTCRQRQRRSSLIFRGIMTKLIDWDKIDNYFICGASITQCAAQIGCSVDTLERRCRKEKNAEIAQYHQEKREKGNLLLHAAQFDKAIKEKNPTMLIWLGKQRLGQKEIIDDRITKDIEKKFDQQMSKIMDLLSPSDELKAAIVQDFESQRNMDDNSINSAAKS